MLIFVLIEKITFFLFLVYIIRSVIYHVYLWQLKEYRLDRVVSHLKTPQGKKLLLNPLSWFKLLVLAVSLMLAPLYNSLSVLLLVFLIYSFQFSNLVYKRNIIPKLPILNIRASSILIFSLLVGLLLLPFINNLLDFPTIILAADRLVFSEVAIGVFLTSIPSRFKKKYLAFLAGKKILKYKNLTTIGITGSFGKTSTKEFLASLLSRKFKVSKTEDYHNTEVGVAQDILNRLTSGTNVFIAEMGAYKKGEIASICKIVNPQIGIVTGINQQHLDLFGSIERIMATKFELISSLKKNGIAVFNAGNCHVQKMIEWTKSKRPDLAIFRYQQQEGRGSSLSAANIEVNKDSLSFDLVYKGKKVSCQANIVGKHNVDNLLAASAVALSLGMNLEEIKNSISRVTSPANTMRLSKGLKGSAFVDDTFNANYHGVIAALNYMSVFSGKKILILTPLIELGKESKKIHQDIGEKAAAICQLIFLTNTNYYDFITGGASRVKNGQKKIYILDKETVKTLKENIEKEGVVLFSGKEAGKILRQLLN